MPRLPAIEHSRDPLVAGLISDIRRDRGELLLLYRVLLNSPEIARGWLSLLTAVRQKTRIPAGLRELVILRIARLNQAPYEFANHLPYARQAGVDDAWLDALAADTLPPDLPSHEAAVLRYTDEMTRNVTVRPETLDAVAAKFDAQQLLEVTVTIAAYNMVSRVLVALEIQEEHP